MENKVLKIGETIKLGWQSLTSRFGFWAAIVGITIVAGLIPLLFAHMGGTNVTEIIVTPANVGAAATQAASKVQTMAIQGGQTADAVEIVKHVSWGIPHLSAIIGLLIGTFTALGWTHVALKTAYGEETHVKDFFDPMRSGKKYFSFLIASILYGLILFAGFILLIFPAFIWGPRYSLWPYFVVRHNMGPIEALKASAATAHGAKFDLLAFFLLVGLLNLAGVAVFYVGFLVTTVLGRLAKAQVFKSLLSQTKLPAELTHQQTGK